jgi:hypothetical protein
MKGCATRQSILRGFHVQFHDILSTLFWDILYTPALGSGFAEGRAPASWVHQRKRKAKGGAPGREMRTVHILNTCRFLEQADLIPLFVMFLDIEYSATY